MAWPWFALGGGYIGGEFRPLDFFGLVPNGLCQWLARILRRYRRNAANRAGGFVRPGLGPRLKPVQLAAQGFDFLPEHLHFLGIGSRDCSLKFVSGHLRGGHQLEGFNFLGIFGQQGRRR